MKKLYLNISLLLFFSLAFSQVDRSKMPVSGPTPTIELGTPIEFELKNGLKVLMVENHKLPRVSASLLIDNPPKIGSSKNGIYSLTSSMLGKGSKSITKDTFIEEIDFLGATLSVNAEGAYASSLSRFFPKVLEMMADGALNPLFSAEEFDKEKTKTLEGIKSNSKSVTAIARRVESVLAYGKDHPSGKFISEESINNISFEDVKKYYKENFIPNNSYLVIIGDFNPNETRKMIRNLFSGWKKGELNTSNWKIPSDINELSINFIDVSNAIQSEIVYQNLVDISMNHPDYFPVIVSNKILGGGPENRLEKQIRETKGYTYAARSSIGSSKYTKSRFRASTSTRFQVTDSAVVELLNEIKKIKTINVSDKELSDVKAKYVGNFVLSSESPSTIANYALNIKTQSLDKDFYKNYLSNINKVSKEDIIRVSKKYFQIDKGQIIITGKGSELINKLEKISFENKIIPILFFDKYGNQVEKPILNKKISKEVNVKTIFENYLNAIGGLDEINKIKSISTIATVKIQNAPFSPTAEIKQKHPNLNSLVMTVEGMGTLMSQKFDGENGYIEQMGQKIPFEEDQINSEKEKLGLFEETYLDSNKMEIISLNPIDGKDLYKIKVNGKSFRYYDAATNLLIIKEETVNVAGNEITSTTKYSNYKEIEGVLFPYKREITSGPQTVVFEISSIKFNEEIDDSFFK
jgi:predicted Zn-dependent peptidase